MTITKRHELAEKVSNLVLSVLDDGPIERSRSFLPIDSRIPIRSLETTQIVGRPHLPFRGDRLAVWSSVADGFFIEDVRVGNRSLSVQSGSAPADAFATRLDLLPLLDQQLDEHGFVQIRVSKRATECFGQVLAFPLCPIGQEILLCVTNVSPGPLRFVGVVLGDIEHPPHRPGASSMGWMG